MAMLEKYAPMILLTLALTMATGQPSHAQSGLKASLTHYDTTDGLCSNALSCFAQDDYGYLWIGTWNGLSRFDGYEFLNYPTGVASGVPMMHNRIVDIAIDGMQNVWMRMYDYRVFVLNRKTDRIENPFEDIEEQGNIRVENKMIATMDGCVWLIQSSNKGLYCCKPTDNGFELSHVETRNLVGRDIVEGYRGELWMGTNRGLYHINRQTMSVDSTGFAMGESITDTYSNGYNIYIGTRNGNIYELENGSRFTKILSVGERIYSIFRDSRGIIWFSTAEDGVFRYKPSDGSIKRFTQQVKTPAFDTTDAHMTEVGGIVWVSMNHGGFGYYNRQKDEIEYFHNRPDNSWDLSNTVNCYKVMEEGVIWESTSGRGLEKLEIQNTIVSRHPLFPGAEGSANEVRAMFYDSDRDLLFMSNKSSSLIIEKGSGGKIGKGKRTVITDDGNGHKLNRIYGISRDSEGNYWIACKSTGIFRMTPVGDNSYKFLFIDYARDGDDSGLNSKECYQTVEDLKGNIWVATYGNGINILSYKGDGKWKVANSSNILTNYPQLEYKNVRTVARDKDGRIWAGTTDGILVMQLDNGNLSIDKVSEMTNPDHNLMSKDIVCINISPQGDIWIGTNGGGIARFIGWDDNGNYMFDTFRSNSELAFGEIKSLTFDSMGNVWFANDNIICTYDPAKNVFSSLNFQDGLDGTVCSETAALTLPGNNLLFGTLSGYYLLDINKLFTSDGATLKVRVTDFFLNDKLMTPRLDQTFDYCIPDSGIVRLPKNSSVPMFRFASLNFGTQHRVHYQYMLEGYDSEWQSANRNRTASYAGLPKGKYKFRVRAFLTEAPEKYDECSITIIVPPPFWLSIPAICLYVLLFIALIAGIVYYKATQKSRIRKMRVLRVGPEDIAFKEEDDYEFVKKQLEWLEEHFSEPEAKIYNMIQSAAMSRAAFYNKLKELTGMSPKEFITDFRIKKAKMFIANTNLPLSEVAYKTGFNDPIYFGRVFKAHTGSTPSQYRETHSKKNEPAQPIINKEDDSPTIVDEKMRKVPIE